MNPYTDWQDEQVVVSLMLTDKCNFECAHCFYNCGPKSGDKYMTHETLEDTRIFIQELLDNDVRVSVNFIGGEPTLNLNEFERCLNSLGHLLDNDYCEFQMTTNGWWLKNDVATKKFFNIVKPYIDAEYPEESLVIRISQDKFHDEFRPEWLTGKKLANHLASIWEHQSLFYKETWCCGNCHEQGEGYEDTCPKCESDDIAIDTETLSCFIPEPDCNHPWIYVEQSYTFSSPDTYVVPQGRGINIGGNDKGKGQGYCTRSGMLTFRANGALSDICCSGSDCPMGTVKDNPSVLLQMAKRFGEETKPNCFDCQSQWANWMNENPNLKSELQEKLNETIEMLECA